MVSILVAHGGGNWLFAAPAGTVSLPSPLQAFDPTLTEPIRYYLRVRYGECDAQYVVFNARYGDYVDLASTEYLKTCFCGRNLFDGSFEYQVVRQLTEWQAPARFDQVIEIAVCPARLGSTSFALRFELRRAGTVDLIATCETVYVLVDHASWKKRAMTDEERRLLQTGAAGKRVDHAGYLATGPAPGTGT
jgi:acyl-CoA thioester hydrolase